MMLKIVIGLLLLWGTTANVFQFDEFEILRKEYINSLSNGAKELRSNHVMWITEDCVPEDPFCDMTKEGPEEGDILLRNTEIFRDELGKLLLPLHEFDQEFHIAISVCLNETDKDGINSYTSYLHNLLFSVALFRTNNASIHFHLVTENAQSKIIAQDMIDSAREYKYFQYHIITLEDYIPGLWYEFDMPLKDQYHQCIYARIKADILFPELTSLFWMDIDMILLHDLTLLWYSLDLGFSTDPKTIFGMAGEQTTVYLQSEWPIYANEEMPLGISTGLTYFKLDRMRNSSFSHIYPQLTDAALSTKCSTGLKEGQCLGRSDQDIYNVYFRSFPEQLVVFPCEWNVMIGNYRVHEFGQNTCLNNHENEDKIIPVILHGTNHAWNEFDFKIRNNPHDTEAYMYFDFVFDFLQIRIHDDILDIGIRKHEFATPYRTEKARDLGVYPDVIYKDINDVDDVTPGAVTDGNNNDVYHEEL